MQMQHTLRLTLVIDSNADVQEILDAVRALPTVIHLTAQIVPETGDGLV